jgi:hypothetical protein
MIFGGQVWVLTSAVIPEYDIADLAAFADVSIQSHKKGP